jgi:glyoxylase-like metal-dependent hydrolase (beta-lactamase superfamily II)/rhodanese-related sulfurtransferase
VNTLEAPAVIAFVDEGIGHSSYLIDLGDGSALVIDPHRIPERERTEATARGLRIAFTADTHSHADFISGSPELAADGATFLAPTAAHLDVPHHGLRDRDVVPVGPFTLEAIATPGHTPDHLAYLLQALDGTPLALFSGGLLMVGAVGRPDLLGPAHTRPLAHQAFHSLRERILTLPDDLAVYPTHGAGSFCSAPGRADRTTTIGQERTQNPLLQITDENTFVETLLHGLGSFPVYFCRLPEVNRHGPRLYGTVPPLARLHLGAFRHQLDKGAQLVDARPVTSYAAAHIPGAIAIPLRPVFATWLGWLIDPDQPVLFVLDDNQDRHDLVRQCLTVGVEQLGGELAGGITTWQHADLPTASIALQTPGFVHAPVFDVRQRDEYLAGHLPDAVNVELGALAQAHIAAGPVTLMCAHGERAVTGASLLERGGHQDVAVLVGGPDDWAAVTEHDLTVGE